MRFCDVARVTVLGAAMAATVGCAGRTERTSAGDVAVGAQPTLATMIAAWPSSSRTAADQMIAKYGAPDEQTASMLIWHDRGPFRRTIVHRDEVTHAFPRQHLDVLEQVIPYRVPPEMADELAAFNGSLSFDRTKGELSARCDREAMNVLALNLADELLTRRATVTDARIAYALQAEAHAAGRPAVLTERLQFRVASIDTRDADTPLSPPNR
jgi:hypothetical protein